MPLEIERKFLLKPEAANVITAQALFKKTYRQGYLVISKEVELRVSTDGREGEITVKGIGDGLTRPEFEMVVSHAVAEHLLTLCLGSVHKSRYVWCGWEFDVYYHPHTSLVLAEIELPHEDFPYEFPEWIKNYVDREVTFEAKFKNRNVALAPRNPELVTCHSDGDGACLWKDCPQHLIYQTGCPLYPWHEQGE